MKTRFEIKLAIFALCASTAIGAETAFTFKGFSLGMSLDEAEKLIKEKYSTAFGEVTSGQIPDDMRHTFTMRGSKATYMIAISAFRFPDGIVDKLCVVEADSQKKVIAFRFPDRVVDMLFSSGDMTAQDFAKQFLDSYKLPELKASSFPPLSRPTTSGWEYTSPKGFRVRISENKDLIVEAVPSSGERKFD